MADELGDDYVSSPLKKSRFYVFISMTLLFLQLRTLLIDNSGFFVANWVFDLFNYIKFSACYFYFIETIHPLCVLFCI